MKKYIILVITILLLSGCSLYNEYKMPKKVNIKTINKTYKVYDKAKVKDLIKKSNVKIINNQEVVNTKKTGKHTVTIEYKYKLLKYKLDVSYKVIDDEKPTLLYAPTLYTKYLGEDEDFCSNTIYIDNYDRSSTCSIEGEYDINQDGDYNLKYIIKDKENNSLEEDFTLTVIDPDLVVEEDDDEEIDIIEPDDESTEEGVDFKEIIKHHKNKDTMIGIDVSRWQGDIDFKKVKKAGAEFVIMRMAVSNGKKDKIGLDSFYKKNIVKAKNAGLKVGVYVYTAASSTKEIKEQANFVKKELNKTKLDFPIAYDFESWDEIKKLKLNKHDLINYVDEFYNIVNKDGYDVMIYSSKKYLEQVWNTDDYPVWLAHYIADYTDKTSYEGEYKFWQIASDGIIDGINGPVDIDIYYK